MTDQNILRHKEKDVIEWLTHYPPAFMDEITGSIYSPLEFGHLELAVHVGIRPEHLDLTFKGDIDLLVYPLAKPENATAFQIKQSKFLRDNKGHEYFEKNIRKKLRKGFEQTSRDQQCQFWLTYLLLFIEYNGADNYHGFGFPPPQMYSKIKALITQEAIHFDKSEGAEIAILTISQTSSRSIDFSGGISKEILRAGTRRSQPRSLTDSLKRLKTVNKHFCNVKGCSQAFLTDR
jgi:hypothetical protein